VKGRGLLSIPTVTDSGGLPVTDRYEIDTNLLSSWTDLARAFQKWRVRELRFNFVSCQGTNLAGLVAMAVMPDPDAATASTLDYLMGNQHSVVGPHYSCPSLLYVPRRSTNWLYTQDILADEDRLEMPGDFFLQSSLWTSVQTPGRVYVDYWVEFTEVTNVNASLTKQLSVGVKKDKDQSHSTKFPATPTSESPRTRASLRDEIKGLITEFNLAPP
jgi:hypothetical protein